MADLTPLLQELQSALVSGDEAEARRAALALAARAVEDIPALHAALNMLGYHGRLDLANEVMAEAWPRLKEDEGYSRPAVTAFMSRATDHLIYHYLESTPPAGLDADLVEALERYFEVDTGRLELYLAFLRGESGRRWQPADFATLDAHALSGLLVEFVGLAHRAGVSYSRAHLVRDELPRYLLDRRAGYLYPREDVAALLRTGRRPPPAATGAPAEPLVPDRLTLLNFVQKLVQTIQPQPYVAAALVELMPLWLRFLALRGLITEAVYEEAIRDLDGLAAELAPVWHGTGDPLLVANLLGAGQ
ncbi:MAG: hypothetical protein GX579_15260 [Chloroflexi bacterium]|nr:hypothetical protein [Chloroflexota bacterium]